MFAHLFAPALPVEPLTVAAWISIVICGLLGAAALVATALLTDLARATSALVAGVLFFVATHRLFRGVAPDNAHGHLIASLIIGAVSIAVGAAAWRRLGSLEALAAGAIVAVPSVIANYVDRFEEHMAAIQVGWGLVLLIVTGVVAAAASDR